MNKNKTEIDSQIDQTGSFQMGRRGGKIGETGDGDSEVPFFSYKKVSHRYVVYSIGNIVNNIVINLYRW